MATETLHYENARFAQQLFNHEPRNLQALETELGVKATARDGWIKLEGAAEAVERAKQLFSSLENMLKAGSPVKNREFTHALNVVKHEGATTLKDMVSDRVTTHERKPGVTSKTVGQKKYLDAIRKHDITFGIGPAGTGKTYLAVAMALSALREGTVSRIILTRPAVEAGEALGFLPGDLLEKITPYLRPLHDALHDMLPAEEIQKHMERATIEIAPLAYMRGRTLNGAFIILDEAQNSTTEQMLMFLTRLGHGSKAVITGDETQIDLPAHKHSGLAEAHRALKHTEGIAIVEFSKRDVVRHPLVQRIIAAYEEHRGKAENGNGMNIVVANRQQTEKINSRRLKEITASLLAELQVTEADLGVNLVGAQEMALVNETFLQHEGPTDVITFDHSPPRRQTPDARRQIYGELFICVDVAIRQAKEFKSSWQAEIVRYVVHGVLHLLGHDDLKLHLRRKMKREENRLVRLLAKRFSLAQLSGAAKLGA